MLQRHAVQSLIAIEKPKKQELAGVDAARALSRGSDGVKKEHAGKEKREQGDYVDGWLRLL